ncbi:MAG: hypothetical protein E6Q92_04585 [Burkholderiaceae bacterium]|nr:MAG: hypothetical protein E6Q92_04585 [Burkholderiaceae bacterium]
MPGRHQATARSSLLCPAGLVPAFSLGRLLTLATTRPQTHSRDDIGTAKRAMTLTDLPSSDDPSWEQHMLRHWDELYPDLRRIAQRLMQQERADHTWSATGLVHEVFLRILAKEQPVPDIRPHAPPSDPDAGRQLSLRRAVRVMRHLLIDHARARGAQQRGGDWSRVTWSAVEGVAAKAHMDVLALESALRSLETEDPRAAQVLELRVFGGLGVDECAQALALSPATVKRDWLFARGHLARHWDVAP